MATEPVAPTASTASAPAPLAPSVGQLAQPQPEPTVSVAQADVLGPSPAPSAPEPEPVDGIGSEGFGPHVQRALDSGDPRQALDAARWTAKCHPDNDAEAMLSGNHPKYRLVLSPEARQKVITNARKEQRRCQTLTPDLKAQHRALALRALDAKVPGSGLAYYQSLDRENRSPAELARALQGLRQDVEQGQDLAVPPLALAELGQSRAERLAYDKLLRLLVLKDVLPAAPGGLMPSKPPDPPYSPEEQAEAAELVKRLWPRVKPPG